MADLEKLQGKGLVENYDNVLSKLGPAIEYSITSVGGRSMTNWMDWNLNIQEQPTPIGKARQILAELGHIGNALAQAKQSAAGFFYDNIYVHGAMKRAIGYAEAYQKICNELGVQEITNEMVEADQPEYHLKSCFLFALRSAASNGGYPDEGDFKYAHAVGISVSQLTTEIRDFLYDSNSKIKPFGIVAQNKWLQEMWEKYNERI